ncbi:MAG: hypothetical protein J2P36_23405, partial [Ktedonobacteraceae bacterium]|nr:hypothetical protein [Ktedonobacteraceae bacterium]
QTGASPWTLRAGTCAAHAVERRKDPCTLREKFFGLAIRIVFIVAFGSFLMASIHHVATFFHNFEPDATDWTGSFLLAISVDGTALMLTIGMMFFSRNMPLVARILVWTFIIGLTAFSWVVNWEYAVAYQKTAITGHLDPIWRTINPILASSFAFLNLAYSIVAEFFNARDKTVEELQDELDGLTGERAALLQQIEHAKKNKPSFIERAKNAALEIKSAAGEVMGQSEHPTLPETNQALADEPSIAELSFAQESEQHQERVTEVLYAMGEPFLRTGHGTDGEAETERVGDGLDGEEGREEGRGDETCSEVETAGQNERDAREWRSDTTPIMEVVHHQEEQQTGSSLPGKAEPAKKFLRRKPMTTAEVAAVLGCTERHVHNLRKSGTLLQNEDRLITAASVRACLESRKAKVS